MDWKLELIAVPVSDVDRAKSFYLDQLGFELLVDHSPNDAFRIVQMVPPGSACAIAFGKGLKNGEPGSVKGLHLVVKDIEAARGCFFFGFVVTFHGSRHRPPASRGLYGSRFRRTSRSP